MAVKSGKPKTNSVDPEAEIEQAVFNARILLILDGMKESQEANTARIDRLEQAAVKVLGLAVLNLVTLVGTLAAIILKR